MGPPAPRGPKLSVDKYVGLGLNGPLPGTPTHLACLMAPSRVLKSAPHSSTTQWKWAL